MKRTLASCALLVALTATAVAQEEQLQFVDKDGNAVPSGTTIRVSDLAEDQDMGNNLNSGLFVKNMSDEQIHVRMAYEVVAIDNGTFQICFPVTCNIQTKTGSYETAAGPLEAGALGDVASEWFPDAFGSCTVKYQLEVMELTGFFPRQSYQKVADGPNVTVVFEYDDPSAISTTTRDIVSTTTEQCFDLLGRKVNRHGKGLSIVRLTDGSIQKRLAR